MITRRKLDLHNDHNVYICGAGFSVDGGIPTVGTFFAKIRDAYEWLLRRQRHEEADAIQQVISFRVQSSAAGYWTKLDLENIEELFSLAAASSKPTLLEALPMAISATIDYSRSMKAEIPIQVQTKKALETRFPGLRESAVPAQEGWSNWIVDRYTHHVGKLLGVYQDGTVVGENSFITFNYDTLLEEGLKGLDLPFSYHLGKQSSNYDSTDVSQRGGSDAIKVLKLHGSMNWARKKTGRGRKFTVFGKYSDVRDLSLAPEIVPPTWKKTFSGPLIDVWDEAVRSIEKATRLVIIGFSIPHTDTHFKYLVSAGLRRNASLRSIHVVDPDQTKTLRDSVLQFIPGELEQRGILKFHPTFLSAFTQYNTGPSTFEIGRPWNVNAFTQWS